MRAPTSALLILQNTKPCLSLQACAYTQHALDSLTQQVMVNRAGRSKNRNAAAGDSKYRNAVKTAAPHPRKIQSSAVPAYSTVHQPATITLAVPHAESNKISLS